MDFGGSRIVAVALVLAAVSPVAQAADASTQEKSGLQFGVGLGQGTLHITIPGVPGSDSLTAVGYKAFVGWRFNRNLAVEGAYVDTGHFSDSVPGESLSVHPRIVQGSVLGTWPLSPEFAVFARLGADHWDTRLQLFDAQLGIARVKGSDTDFVWGVGATTFLDGAQLRLEYEQSKANQNLADVLPINFRARLLSVSVVWLF
jgi:opacity protein-like surface antigen